MHIRSVKPFHQGPWSLEVNRRIDADNAVGRTNFVLVHEAGQRFQLGHLDVRELQQTLQDHHSKGTAPVFQSADIADCGGSMRLASGLIQVDCDQPKVGASFGMADVYQALEDLWA